MAFTKEEKDKLALALAKMQEEIEAQKAELAASKARESEATEKVKELEASIEKLADNEPSEESYVSPMQAVIAKTSGSPEFMAAAQSLQAQATIDSAILPMRKSFPAGIGLTSADVPTRAHDAGFIGNLPFAGVRLRDVIPVVPIAESSVEYVRARFSHLAAVVATAADTGDTSIVLDNAEGFAPKQEIKIGPEGASQIVTTVTSVNYDTKTITIPALGTAVAAGQVVTADRFVFVPEARIKPRAKAVFEQETEAVKTLPHWIPVTRQALADSRQLQGYLERELVEGLVLSEEKQILKGSGGTREFLGIMNDPDVLSYAWSSGAATDTQVDAIRQAMQLIFMASNAQSDAIVLSGWDDVKIATLKNANGDYLFGGPSASSGVSRIWGVPVVVSAELEEGEAVVGAFRASTTLWDRESTTIRLSEHHEDFFVRNCVALLAERRAAFTIQRPEGLVKLDISTAPSP